MAPGADGTVWAGDIGDNRKRRDDVTVYRVQPRDGEQPGHAVHPDLPRRPARRRDAARPPGDRPALRRVQDGVRRHRLRRAAAAPRRRSSRTGCGPSRTCPGWSRTARSSPTARTCCCAPTAPRPSTPSPASTSSARSSCRPQRQGEGIAVSPRGRVLVSSEGVHADVLRLSLPADLTGPAAPSGTPAGPAPATRPPVSSADTGTSGRSAKDWGWIALVGVGLAGLGYLSVRGARVARCSTTWSMQAVSASTSAGSMAGNIAMRSWLRPSLR